MYVFHAWDLSPSATCHTRTVAAEDGLAGETRDWRNSAASEALPLTMTSMIAERSRHASSQAATTF